MQAASVFRIPAAPKMVDTADDFSASGASESGRGIHISSSQPAKSGTSLFNKILHQGMTPREHAAPNKGEPEKDAPGMPEITDGAVSMDVCALLVQLNVLGAAGTAAGPAGENAGIAAIPAVAADNLEMAGNIPFMADMVPDGSEGQAALLTGDGSIVTESRIDPSEVLRQIADAMGAAEQKDVPAAEHAGGGDPLPDVYDGAAAGGIQGILTEGGTGTGEHPIVTGAVPAAETGLTAAPGKPEAAVPEAALSAADGGLEQMEITGFGKVSSHKENAVGDNGQTAGEDRRESSLMPDAGSALRAAGGPAGLQTAAERVSQAEKTAAVDKAFLRLADDVCGLRADRQEISIVLEPESFGVLTISVVRTAQGISAKIKSEDRDICAIMSDRLRQLISTMETRGITVQDVDIEYSRNEQDAGFPQQTFSQREQTSGSGGGAHRDQRRSSTSGDTVWEAEADAGGDDSGETTVEYRV